LTGTLKDVENRHIESMLSMVRGPAGRYINLPYGLVMAAGYKQCWLATEGCLPCPYPVLDGEYSLSIPGVTDTGNSRIVAAYIGSVPEGEDSPYRAFLDAEAAGTDITIRTRRRGDRFQPVGLGAEKKVARYMLDARLPRHWRAEIPLVISEGRVAWLVGQRLDERFKVTSGTMKILKLEYFSA
jgi:tRNA(Ile)-lysidine synthase